jgi:hypothetical protein
MAKRRMKTEPRKRASALRALVAGTARVSDEFEDDTRNVWVTCEDRSLGYSMGQPVDGQALMRVHPSGDVEVSIPRKGWFPVATYVETVNRVLDAGLDADAVARAARMAHAVLRAAARGSRS